MRSWFLSVRFLKCILFAGIVLIILFSCRRKPEVLKSPPGYDFSKAIKDPLELKLREVSGIAWDHIKNEFAVICDERGRVYFLDKESKAIMKDADFAEKGDYEDIAYVNSTPYILRSDGIITKCNIDSAGKYSGTELGKLDIPKGVDFESMYYDPGRKALILLCKNCGIDDKKKVSAFAYYLDSTGFDTNPVYQIDVDAVHKLAPKESSRLEPSAAAIHPVQQKLYIISAGSKELVITDLNGKVEGVFVLSAELFPQAEGICFKQSGEMYISNEGGTGKASLLRFNYPKK